MTFRPSRAHRALAIFLVGSAVTFSTESIALGPRSSAAKTPAFGFVWHDLVTDNPAASRAFYGALFGWTFEDGEGVDPGYTIIKQDGVAIGGVVTLRRTADPVVAQ